MVGGTIFHRQVIQREISRALVLNLLWQSKRCSGTAQDKFALDRAFSLIEGHPASGQPGCASHNSGANTKGTDFSFQCHKILDLHFMCGYTASRFPDGYGVRPRKQNFPSRSLPPF